MKLPVAFTARALALLWAGFWLFFFVAESLAWRTPLHVMMIWVTLGLVFLLVTVVAWRWEATGGVLLLVVAFVAGIAYAMRPPADLPALSVAITTVVLSVPPLVAGILFLLHHRAAASKA